MQLLSFRREFGSPLGQASFSLLLFQDLAVVPLLVLVGLLGQHGDGSFALQMGQAALKGVVHHRRHLPDRPTRGATGVPPPRGQPAVRHLHGADPAGVARRGGTDLGRRAVDGNGALLAGLIIAETEFRHAVEVTIEPFCWAC